MLRIHFPKVTLDFQIKRLSFISGSSQRNCSRGGPYSPGFEFDDDSHSKYVSDRARNKFPQSDQLEDLEKLRNEFRRPRDVCLNLVAEFVSTSSSRLAELNKKFPQVCVKRDIIQQ